MVPSGDHHTARKGAPGTGQRERRGHMPSIPLDVLRESEEAPLEPYRPELASTRRPMSGRRPPLVDLCGPSSWSRPPPKEATLSDWSCNGSTGARQPFGKPTTAWEPVRRGIPRAINPLSSPPACTKPDGASRSCNGNKEAFPAVRCDQPSKNSSPVRWRAPSGMPESHAPQKDSERNKPHRAAQLFPYFSKAQRGARRPSPRLP